MRREIKFRAKKEKDPKEWAEGYFVFDVTGDFIVYGLFSWRIDSATLGQLTGILDKNEKNIFEDDVLRVTAGKTSTICKVVFTDGRFIGLTKDNVECDLCFITDVEILGNIHDNPELMEAS